MSGFAATTQVVNPLLCDRCGWFGEINTTVGVALPDSQIPVARFRMLLCSRLPGLHRLGASGTTDAQRRGRFLHIEREPEDGLGAFDRLFVGYGFDHSAALRRWHSYR